MACERGECCLCAEVPLAPHTIHKRETETRETRNGDSSDSDTVTRLPSPDRPSVPHDFRLKGKGHTPPALETPLSYPLLAPPKEGSEGLLMV